MDLRNKPGNNSKALRRFRIKNRVQTNPEEYAEPTVAYFNKIAKPNSLLSMQSDLAKSSIQPKQKLQQKTQSTINSLNNNSLNNFLSLDSNRLTKIFSSSFNENTVPRESQIKNSTSKQERFAMVGKQQSKTGLKQEPKQIRNGLLHLSYEEYQQFIRQSKIESSYFQNLAIKNDGRVMETNQKIVHQNHNNNHNKVTEKSIKKDIFSEFLSEKIEQKKPNKNTKKTNPKINQNHKKHQVQIIFGSNLGALSTHQIKDRLQMKWQEEQKAKRLNINSYTFTEQSQFGSEIDTKLHTKCEQVSFLSDKKTKKTNQSALQKQDVNWNMINNQKIKNSLRQILQIHTNNRFKRDSQKQFSKGEEYETQQQNMFLFTDVYRTKQFVLKHKLQWQI